MEAVGLAVGAVGLAGLFSTCVDCFELVQRGRYLGKDYLLLETKFSNQRLRFTSWGRACGLMNAKEHDFGLDEEELKPRIEETLTQILWLFNDGKVLRKRYGLKRDHGGNHIFVGATSSSVSITNSPWAPAGLFSMLQGLKNRMENTQKQANLSTSTRWAIEDNQKFMNLVQHLKDLIDDLESITKLLDVVSRQREMIQAEIEYISEIPTLEAMEEARAGNVDAVSDAASLRLCKLRDRYKPDNGMRITSNSNNFNQVAMGPCEEWDMLPEASTKSHPDVPDTNSKYQVLHRVHCASCESMTIYFDPPTYLSGRYDVNQWALLDPDYPTVEEDIYHLCGRRPVANLEGYLKQNCTLQFLVFQEYQCCDGTQRPRDTGSLSVDQSIRLISNDLCSALQMLDNACLRLLDDPLSNYEAYAYLRINSELKAPYPWFYHRRKAIMEHSEILRGQEEIIDPVFQFVGDSMSKDYDAADDEMSRGVISRKFLPLLFVPGQLLLEHHAERGVEHDRGLEQTTWPQWSIVQNGHLVVEFGIRSWYLVERFQRTDTTAEIIFQFSSDDSKVEISSLSVFPLCYAEPEVKQNLRQRGEMFWYFRTRAYVSYSGISADSEECINGRFMIDAATRRKMQQDRESSELANSPTNDLDADTMAADYPPRGNFVFLLPPTVYGFDMYANKWLRLVVSRISHIRWGKKPLDNIMVDPSTKELLYAMVSEQTSTEADWDSDVIRSRKRGPFLLFDGPPSTGKTLAGECIAEYLKKPLQSISLVSIGTNANELEIKLQSALYLGKIWGSVTVLDDADAVLGTKADLARNAIVTTLMRFLGETNGIVILKTNHVTRLDEALKSRIHLTVHFNFPLFEEMLWRLFTRQLVEQGIAENNLLDSVEQLKQYRTFDTRKIRHAISAATKLASHRGRKLDYDVLFEVINLLGHKRDLNLS